MNVNPGEMNKRIRIERASREQDAAGYGPKTWEPVLETWAKVTRESGSELRQREADYSLENLRLLLRTPAQAIDRKMTVVYRDRRYEIDYLNDYGDRGEYLEMLVHRRTMEAS